MRKLMEVMTPENVSIEYELAGLGSRFAAALIDSLIQGGLLVLTVIAMAIAGLDIGQPELMSSVVWAVGIAVLFLIWSGYYIFFEMLMNGQTPGKRLNHLRVVRQTGEPIGFFDSFLRNIVRIADMLPGIYLAGSLFVLFSRHNKRIGDFAANTLVVKTGRGKQKKTLEELVESYSQPEEPSEAVNLYSVTPKEYGVLKEFLDRSGSLGAKASIYAQHLDLYFRRKFQLEKPVYSDPVRFFEEIVRMNSGR